MKLQSSIIALTTCLFTLSASAIPVNTSDWPAYSDVTPGTWTMNYDGVMEASKTDGRDVLVLFSGALWCPYCAAMETNVFSKAEWKTEVADKYLVLVDLERRNGNDPTLFRTQTYLDYAQLSTEDAAAHLRTNYLLQNQYALPGCGSIQAVIQNRYGLPNGTGTIPLPYCIVMKGEAGKYPERVGRFGDVDAGINQSNPNGAPAPQALANSISKLNALLTAAKPEIITLETPELDSSLTTNNTFTADVKTHYYRFTPEPGTAWHITAQSASDATASVELFSTATPALALVSLRDKNLKSGISLSFVVQQESYYLKVTSSSPVAYTLTSSSFEAAIEAQMVAQKLTVRKSAASISVSVKLNVLATVDSPVSVTLTPEECVPASGYIAAQAGIDFVADPIVVTWTPAELRRTKTVKIPLLNPNPKKWEGDKQFLVAITDGVGCSCSSDTENRETLVTIDDTVTRKPGKLSFAGFGEPMMGFDSATSPELASASASTQTVWIARTDGADDTIGASVTYTKDGTTTTLTNFTWQADDTSPKAVTIELPVLPDNATTAAATLDIIDLQNGATLKTKRLGTLPVIAYTADAPCFTNPTNNVFNLVTAVNTSIAFPFTNKLDTAVTAKIISGTLPTGLKLSLSGSNVIISGIPTKAADVVLGLQLSTKVKIGTRTTTLIGQTLPVAITVTPFTDINPTLAGTYTAYLSDLGTGNGMAGLLTATVSSAGKVSLKVEVESQSLSVSNGIWTEVDEDGVFHLSGGFSSRGVNYQVAIWVDGETLGGTFYTHVYLLFANPYEVTGNRKTWSKTNSAASADGYYTAILPPSLNEADLLIQQNSTFTNAPAGYGYTTLTVTPSTGAVRYSGKLADGTAISGSTTLLAAMDGDDPVYLVPVYKSLYSKNGFFGALFVIRPGLTVDANTVSLLDANWQYGGKSTYAYNDAFWMINMDADNIGGYFTKNQNLADYYLDKYGFIVPNPGIDYMDKTVVTPLDADLLPDQLDFIPGASGSIKFDTKNVSKASITASKTTGLMSGRFSIFYTYTNSLNRLTTKTISNSYYGVLTPYADCPLGGAGYFLLPDNTLPKPFNTLKQSFPVYIEKLDPLGIDTSSWFSGCVSYTLSNRQSGESREWLWEGEGAQVFDREGLERYMLNGLTE